MGSLHCYYHCCSCSLPSLNSLENPYYTSYKREKERREREKERREREKERGERGEKERGERGEKERGEKERGERGEKERERGEKEREKEERKRVSKSCTHTERNVNTVSCIHHTCTRCEVVRLVIETSLKTSVKFSSLSILVLTRTCHVLVSHYQTCICVGVLSEWMALTDDKCSDNGTPMSHITFRTHTHTYNMQLTTQECLVCNLYEVGMQNCALTCKPTRSTIQL